MAFTNQLTVRMYDTDAAGILYFGSQFRLVHDTFEALLEHENIDFNALLTTSPYSFVIAHASSDYMEMLKISDKVDVKLWIARVGETSFTCEYELLKASGEVAGRAKTVHVCIDAKTKQKMALPEELLEKLGRYKGRL